ncbi:hypothetical protein ANTPLA_LOCUS7755 [Anthophora plagiata]
MVVFPVVSLFKNKLVFVSCIADLGENKKKKRKRGGKESRSNEKGDSLCRYRVCIKKRFPKGISKQFQFNVYVKD